MRNLTSNAIKATKETDRPQIKWGAKKQAENTVITISDNGSGIAKNSLEALYSPDKVVGIKSGLGLHIIRDLALAINCTVRLEQTSSSDSTFFLTF
ncbi:MAG: ATP-binding protein [Aestuariibaculum sp.]